jgi:predicted metalloprotease with PDZ domain
VLGEVARDTPWADQFFRRYLEGREVVDYEALLARAGFLLRRANPGSSWLGGELEERDGAAWIAAGTLIDSSLYRVGVDRRDRIVSLDGRPLAAVAEVEAAVAARRPGDSVPLEWEQRGKRKRGLLVLAEDPRLEVVTYEKAGRAVTPAMRRLRAQWLGSRVRR